MADLILTHGYFLCEDEKEQGIMKPYAPLGLMYLSSYLKSLHIDVELFDTTFSDRASLYQRLQLAPGGILGIYTNLITRSSIVRIMQAAKACGYTIILGGPESANYPEKYMQHGADFVVIGEGEQALAELLPAIRNGNPAKFHTIPGILFRDSNGTIIRTPPRAALRNISAYPWPDRDSIDIGQYQSVWTRHHGYNSVSMITARGCPYRCSWCSHAVFGYDHRRRPPADCAEELAHILGRFQPDQIWYADDVFTISHPWIFDYARELHGRGIHIPFETISRADRLMKPEVLDTLAGMGCARIWIGSESGSQRILDAMQRDVTVEQVKWATHEARARGIKVGMFLMWGYGEETLEDIEKTVRHVKECRPDLFFTTVAYPIKGTPFFDAYADHISLPGQWENSTDRNYKLDIQRTPEYYQAADTLLYNEVEAELASGHDEEQARRCRERAENARRYLREQERRNV
ncbi:MAG: hypothetical protein A3I78_08160 [Gammaproteobacteria bacterium RIFCSPLOWO2_02_FULL_56_15]|nr:MAG: hypothetical protein A3I78_08160 [Gammaproteobacteria bacterium RIFCSPLOWO2_02_FULL_56_15]